MTSDRIPNSQAGNLSLLVISPATTAVRPELRQSKGCGRTTLPAQVRAAKASGDDQHPADGERKPPGGSRGWAFSLLSLVHNRPYILWTDRQRFHSSNGNARESCPPLATGPLLLKSISSQIKRRNGPSMDSNLLKTPLFDWHVAHGARMVDFAGWAMPVQYTSIIEEHSARATP